MEMVSYKYLPIKERGDGRKGEEGREEGRLGCESPSEAKGKLSSVDPTLTMIQEACRGPGNPEVIHRL